jgi:hypothetical protein
MHHLHREEGDIKDILAMYYRGGCKLLCQFEKVRHESIGIFQQQLEQIKAEFEEVFKNTLEKLSAGNEMVQGLLSSEKLDSAIRKRAQLLTRLEEMMQAYEADDSNEAEPAAFGCEGSFHFN